jgi:hypothetical protein
MARKKFTPEALAVLDRRRNVMRRYLRGELQYEIARAYGLDPSTIHRDIAWVHRQWLAEAKVADGDRVARELGKIDEVERTAWAAWEQSRQVAETTRTRRVEQGSGNQTMAELTRQGKAGDPRFLEVILKCSERRCKILGVDKSPPPAAVVVPIPWDLVTAPPDRDEVEARLLAAIERQSASANGQTGLSSLSPPPSDSDSAR